MRASWLALSFLPFLVAPALADQVHAGARMPPHAVRPHLIGKFGQWLAATREGQDGTTCFVFTRAEASAQHLFGRGDVILSVTRRPHSHDVVALTAGMLLSGHEDAQAMVDGTRLLFYIANRSAFARDNQAAIKAFGSETSLAVKLAGPRGIVASDHFSLKGFPGAYAALQKACPAS